ncbi:class I SAM-dependent methyltransferase [Kribbella shirazensis]|uniref:Ubiquinone/menaquinone biosynthesis C-methylase UbiE n=1 Tax=Kribbella shirazensis TaxID=1105143 RepID=A0A7X5VH29_9ACTN|nr:class I SAM-dependent methyltransferase [Kribbella shirazensis]NIK60023.1 ubiquinone/menaquinone biosynthesis C-methylase UbiE [Kribbella shirazensis]
MYDAGTTSCRAGATRRRGADAKYQDWIEELTGRLGPGSRVINVGYGTGVPVTRPLSTAGHRVTGVDISEVQISRARELVPGAEFVNADVMSLDFLLGSFDAIVSLYALVHLPDEQPQLLARIAG